MVARNYLPDFLAEKICKNADKNGWAIHETVPSSPLSLLRVVKEESVDKVERMKTYSILPKFVKLEQLSDFCNFINEKGIYKSIIEWVDFEITKTQVKFLYQNNNDKYSFDELSDIINNFPDITGILKSFPLYLKSQESILRGDTDQIY